MFLPETILKFSLFINCPVLSAVALKMAAQEVNSEGEFPVLCIGRSIFLDDVRAMAIFGKKIRYIVIYRTYFWTIFEHFCDKKELESLTEENYHTDSFCQKGKKKYYEYLIKILPILRKLIKFDAVLTGNLSYVEQQELARVCEARKTPFIVLHKEGLSAGIYKDSAELYKYYKFIGARMLVYNDKVVGVLLGTNPLAGLSEDKVKVVGVPRLDYYFGDMKSSTNKQIVFFSFYPKYRLSKVFTQEFKLREAEKRADDFHKWIMNFAKNHPDFKVTIKTKVAEYYLDYVLDLYKNNFKEKINNLIITNSASSAELIKNSAVVVGYGSMALIESIIAGKAIISAYFGDLASSERWDYFDDYPELINYIKTEEELEDRILNYNKYLGYDPKKREEFLKIFISMPDGRASARAEEAIIETIKKYQC